MLEPIAMLRMNLAAIYGPFQFLAKLIGDEILFLGFW